MVIYDDWTGVIALHQTQVFPGQQVSYYAGTSPNFNDSSLGIEVAVANIIAHPNPEIDLAVVKFSRPISGIVTPTIAAQRPAVGEDVWLSGYGVTGDTARGYVGQDGFIRAGRSRVSSSSPLLGLSREYYQNNLFNPAYGVDSLRAASGDSGGAAFNSLGQWYGINVAASGSISGRGTTVLYVGHTEVSGFILGNSGAAVPEPSSAVSLLTVVGAASLIRRRRDRI